MITRPPNNFKLLPSDLVFCAIPYGTSCYKMDGTSSQSPYEIINMVPLASETVTEINYSPMVDPVNQTTKQPLTTSLHHLQPKTISISGSKQTVLPHSSKMPPQPHFGETETVKENEKGKMKETTEENAPASSKSN